MDSIIYLLRQMIWREWVIVKHSPVLILWGIFTAGILVRIGMIAAGSGLNATLLYSLFSIPMLMFFTAIIRTQTSIAENIKETLLALPVSIKTIFWSKVLYPLVISYGTSVMIALILSMISWFMVGKLSGFTGYLISLVGVPLLISPLVAIFTWVMWFLPQLIANILFFILIFPPLVLGIIPLRGNVNYVEAIKAYPVYIGLVVTLIALLWGVALFLAHKIDKERLVKRALSRR